ncbi:imidazoleglycerol-phosphate dehydratase [Aureococcus anophagefferens]|nr:imidazoleglycerol-phosphate dehydratase [Aureococcus anophagefferens]
MVSCASNDVVAEATIENLGKRGVIGTGICFLDHMVDQLTSHGQLGVSLRVRIGGGDALAPLRDYAVGALAARAHDDDVAAACGGALGGAPLAGGCGDGAAPALTPYGTMTARPGGRRWIGKYRTDLTPLFWRALAAALGCDLTLRRVRGHNAHHVLESAFKAFAAPAKRRRAPPVAWASPAAPRRAARQRATKETTIEVAVDLDAPWAAADPPRGPLEAWTGAAVTPGFLASTVEETPRLATGVPALDDVLSTFAEHAGILVAARCCAGDRYIDDHHTAEDVAITVGQCLCDALGDKAGLTRMASADRERDGVEVRAVLDLSNRPNFHSDLAFDEEYLGGDAAADAGDGECGAVLSSEMLVHALESLTLETRATLHLEGRRDAGGEGHTRPLALAAAAAYGAALGQTIRIDPRRKGAVASSKGTLSK